jgi:hypothetical protein
MDHPDSVPENIAGTIALTVTLWTAFVVGASLAGAFHGLPTEELHALTAFASGFAVAAVFLDPAVRAYVVGYPALGTLAIALDAMAALWLWVALREGVSTAVLGTLPHTVTVFVVLPVAIAASLAWLTRPAPAKIRSREAKSPGATPAAT